MNDQIIAAKRWLDQKLEERKCPAYIIGGHLNDLERIARDNSDRDPMQIAQEILEKDEALVG